MATAVSHPMTINPFPNQSSCEPDEEWFNNYLQSPAPTGNAASTSHMSQSSAPSAPSALTSPATSIAPLDTIDEYPAKPSHEYGRFKQQTGLPSNSIPGLQGYNGFSNTGLDDMNFMNYDMESDFKLDMGMGFSNDLPAFFYPSDGSQQDDFVDPSNISQTEEPAQVRVYPGMHQQQALAKAQAQAQQQRQQQMLQAKRAMEQQQQPQPARAQSSRRSASHQPTDARTEETIARVVNQIRQNSQMTSQDSNQGDVLPHIVRMKKDEEDMDEDERLLASEEGKKLSSKERRQLRNKVSARAFRSRRKEYIGQLEGEVAAKANEANELRIQNRALMEENARSRAFIENLLRHRAFAPFLEELSRDESIQNRLPIQQAVPTPAPQPERKDLDPYQAAQQFQDVARAQNPQIGMALVPETPVDLSMLSIGNNWSSQGVTFPFQQPQVFAVTEIPEGPANPFDTATLSGKGYEAFDEPESEPVDELKIDYPVIESAPVAEATEDVKPAETEAQRAFDSNPAFALFNNISAPSPSSTFSSLEVTIPEEDIDVTVSEASAEEAMARVERICSSVEPVMRRLQGMTS